MDINLRVPRSSCVCGNMRKYGYLLGMAELCQARQVAFSSWDVNKYLYIFLYYGLVDLLQSLANGKSMIFVRIIRLPLTCLKQPGPVGGV